MQFIYFSLKFLSNIGIEKFLIDLSSLSLDCEDSSFKYQCHCGILTRNFKIVNENKLSKLFWKGPTQKEPEYWLKTSKERHN